MAIMLGYLIEAVLFILATPYQLRVASSWVKVATEILVGCFAIIFLREAFAAIPRHLKCPYCPLYVPINVGFVGFMPGS